MQQTEEREKPHKEKLVKYLNGLVVEKQKTFAHNCGTTIGQMRQIAYGNRPCNAKMAIQIDKHSKGQVGMIYMAPDVDWEHVLKALRKRVKDDGAEG